MSKDNKKRRFVRINGKVVPIGGKKDPRSEKPKKRDTAKKKKSTNQATKSALFSFSGIAASIGAGIFASNNIKKANRGQQQAFTFLKEGKTPDFLNKNVALSKRKAKRFTLGGQLLGGALLSQGIQRGLKAAGVENDSLAIDIGAEAGSQAAAELLTRSVRKGQGDQFFKGTKRGALNKAARLTTQATKELAKRLLSRQLRFKI